VNQALNLFWALFASALSYIIFCVFFKVAELRELLQKSLWIAKKA